jgi:adenosine kinase
MEKTGIFYIGNPLLDISCELKDNALVEKYGLAKGQASLATEKEMPLYDELWAMEGATKIPGGSALNSARSTNFMLKNLGHEGKVTYFGSIAKDEKGDTLAKDLSDNGITGNFYIDETAPTGTCAVLVNDQERTLVANLAAACNYNIEHLRANMDALKNAKLIYSTSFFITSNSEALLEVGKYASDNDVPFGFNLSAVFLIQFFKDTVLAALEHADFVFANEDEADAFMESEKIEGGRAGVAKALAGWKKSNTKRERVAIVTQGPLPALVSIGGKDVTEYAGIALSKEQIVDTNGAGDSFVGGFMAQLLLDQDIAKCVDAGLWLASKVVQRSGCTFPEAMEYK